MPIFAAPAWTIGSVNARSIPNIGDQQHVLVPLSPCRAPCRSRTSTWPSRHEPSHAPAVARSPERVEVRELSTDHSWVRNDVLGDDAGHSPTPCPEQSLAGPSPSSWRDGRDVVEGRLREVHGDVVRTVGEVRVQVLPLARVRLVVLVHTFGARGRVRVLQVTGLDLVVDVINVGVDREFEAIGVALPRLSAVRPRVVVRVPDEVESCLAVETR